LASDSPVFPETHSGIEQIELRLLRYYLAVIDELHFGRAAKRLHMSQPPLSQAIRRLEAHLGVQLIDRKSRPIAPTPAGRAFAEAARRALASVEVAVAEARRAAAPSLLRIGCVPHLPAEPLHHFRSALVEHRLASETTLTRLLALEQIRQLNIGELDLGIFPQGEGDEVTETEPLFPGEPLAVFVSRDHRLATNGSVGVDELREESIVTFRAVSPGIHDRWLEGLESAGYRLGKLRDVAGVTDGREVVLAVADGSGAAIMPHSVLGANQAGSIMVRRELETPVAMPDTMLAWRADPPQELANILVGVREVARRLYREHPAAG
jgi:DNA-binding transcriptional LysR family regulator